MFTTPQNPDKIQDTFHVLMVDEDNTEMSAFVMKKLQSFDSGRVFYEFTDEEDLSCCRKMIRVPSGIAKV